MGKIYDYKTGRFTASYRGIVFDLDIRSPITQVYGKSATGKSLLVNFIKILKMDNKFNSDSKNDLSNIFVFDDSCELDDISSLRDSLIVIDRCDLMLTEDILRFIISDKNNHYLLFSRTCLPLNLTPNYYGEFVCNNNTISIEYKFSEVSWF